MYPNLRVGAKLVYELKLIESVNYEPKVYPKPVIDVPRSFDVPLSNEISFVICV